MAFVVVVGKRQHSSWFSLEDAITCTRTLYKRGKKGLSIKFQESYIVYATMH